MAENNKNEDKVVTNTVEKREGVRYANSYKEQLTIRSLIIGALGCIVITMSSMYVCLRMGVLPWPTIFVAVASMALLKMLGNTNVNEINVTHTAMSAGGMVAAGVSFTIPAIWMMKGNQNVSFLTVLIVGIAGTVLGLVFTAMVRENFVVKEQLPYPIGVAASETVFIGDEGGNKAKILFTTLGLTTIFTVIRDWFGKIPTFIVSNKLASHNISFGIYVSPMIIGIGYIIGPVYTGVWMLGAVLGWMILVPVSVAQGWFPDAATANSFRTALGIGLMVGVGVGVFIKGILPKIKQVYGPMFSSKNLKENEINLRWAPLAAALIVFFAASFTEMSLLTTIAAVVGAWLTTSMAAYIVGTAGVNPVDSFGILTLLAIKAITNVVGIEAVLVASVVAIACAVTGDVSNDFKAGYLLRTNPRAQFFSMALGGLIGAVISAITLFALYASYGQMGPGTNLLAPQAAALAGVATGMPFMWAFWLGLALGAVLHFFKLPVATFGAGVYLPLPIALSVFLGGFANYLVKKFKPAMLENGVVVSSGLLGGEGVAGVAIAIIKLAIRG